MVKHNDKTSIGGRKEAFTTTQWSTIFSAQTTDEDRRKAILDKVLRKYWKPVYCYLRRKGYTNEQAKDLTQGFFQEVVLDTNLIRRADQTKGRFRTFLLTALACYITDVHRKEKAKRRSPKAQLIRLECDAAPELPSASSSMRPDQVFNYVWASEILDKVISEVKKECYGTGKRVHWKVFRAKILAPIMDRTQSPRLKDICEKYDIDNEDKASNMIITVKRCFRRILKEQLRIYVQAESEIEDELNELFTAISKGGRRIT